MRYDIIFAPDADNSLRRIRAYDRVAVLDAIVHHLRHEPMRTSKSRNKALRGLRHPQYRLRIGDLRVFYDVTPGQVEVVAVVSKSDAAEWLARWGIRIEQEGGSP
jgi:mRNA-degrading endonuclease RelE of RelBE toxin-antitoxin system